MTTIRAMLGSYRERTFMTLKYVDDKPEQDAAVRLLTDVQRLCGWPPPGIISPDEHHVNSVNKFGHALQHFCTYTDDGTLVGYATASRTVISDIPLEPGTLEFGTLAVHPDWQRQRIATHLFGRFLVWNETRTEPTILGAWSQGPSRTFFDDHPATRFYLDRLNGTVRVYHVLRTQEHFRPT